MQNATHELSDSRALQSAAEYVRSQTNTEPSVAIILGTGLGGLAEQVDESTSISYADIPNFPRSTVAGHRGQLVLGALRGVPVAALQGRFHLYEGYSPQQVVLPLRMLHALGAETLIVTNAAGGLDARQHAGDLMLIRDHIGLPTMSGLNPLIGPNDDDLGPRFPPMTDAYSVELRALAQESARALGISLREGVYAMVSGPQYETPAELRFLRVAGADAVGMSTVPEVITARHMGMRVLAVSCITNVALPAEGSAPDHTDHLSVVATAEAAGEQLARLIEDVVIRL